MIEQLAIRPGSQPSRWLCAGVTEFYGKQKANRNVGLFFGLPASEALSAGQPLSLAIFMHETRLNPGHLAGLFHVMPYNFAGRNRGNFEGAIYPVGHPSRYQLKKIIHE